MRVATNRKAKHFLRKWAYIDSNLGDLSSTEEVQAKILYSSLKELNKDDRRLLADKYRVKVKPYVKDNVLAHKYGMTIQEYKKKRIDTESKLEKMLQKYIEQYADEYTKAIELDHSKY